MRKVRFVQDNTENSLIRIFLWDKNVSFQNKIHEKDSTERAGYEPWLEMETDIKVDQDALHFKEGSCSCVEWKNEKTT